MNNKVSMAVIRRLPKYHRYLREMSENGINRISSKEFSDVIGFTASQIRQDLNNFGGFGQQGYGYNVEDLYNEIGQILGLVKTYNTIIIGAGNLGQALANYNFGSHGFKLEGMFDINPKVTGLRIRDIEIKDMDALEEEIKNKNIDIAFICTNRDAAQSVADSLEKYGVKAIWNFTPVDLKINNQEIIVENVHLIDSLLTLSYFLKEKDSLSNSVGGA
ncbi:MAG: redox-sensing transcriptional repressor Rex [Bacillota bacterium]|nr:redox-sensing transcriptional repressor Rex [Bacillota bacterium]